MQQTEIQYFVVRKPRASRGPNPRSGGQCRCPFRAPWHDKTLLRIATSLGSDDFLADKIKCIGTIDPKSLRV